MLGASRPCCNAPLVGCLHVPQPVPIPNPATPALAPRPGLPFWRSPGGLAREILCRGRAGPQMVVFAKCSMALLPQMVVFGNLKMALLPTPIRLEPIGPSAPFPPTSPHPCAVHRAFGPISLAPLTNARVVSSHGPDRTLVDRLCPGRAAAFGRAGDNGRAGSDSRGPPRPHEPTPSR